MRRSFYVLGPCMARYRAVTIKTSPAKMGCGCGISCWRCLRDWQPAGVWAWLKRLFTVPPLIPKQLGGLLVGVAFRPDL
jgi:hypothetical protein